MLTQCHIFNLFHLLFWLPPLRIIIYNNMHIQGVNLLLLHLHNTLHYFIDQHVSLIAFTVFQNTLLYEFLHVYKLVCIYAKEEEEEGIT